jgi:hypothetical protein
MRALAAEDCTKIVPQPILYLLLSANRIFIKQAAMAGNSRRVRADLINRATLPALLKALDRHVAALGVYMQDYEKNKNEFEAEIAGCEANLVSIQQKVTDTTKVNIVPLHWKIARYKGTFLFSRKGPQNSEQDARTIYNGLIAIQHQLRNFLEEQRFGG